MRSNPQTILAYGMNGKPLPVQHGAPLRLRVEMQIGYKNAKYVDRIEVVDSLGSIGKGRGGWWEDFDNVVYMPGNIASAGVRANSTNDAPAAAAPQRHLFAILSLT